MEGTPKLQEYWLRNWPAAGVWRIPCNQGSSQSVPVIVQWGDNILEDVDWGPLVSSALQKSNGIERTGRSWNTGVERGTLSRNTILPNSVLAQRGDSIVEDVECGPLGTYRFQRSYECYSNNEIRCIRKDLKPYTRSATKTHSVIIQRGDYILEDVEWGPLGMYRSQGSNEC